MFLPKSRRKDYGCEYSEGPASCFSVRDPAGDREPTQVRVISGKSIKCLYMGESGLPQRQEPSKAQTYDRRGRQDAWKDPTGLNSSNNSFPQHRISSFVMNQVTMHVICGSISRFFFLFIILYPCSNITLFKFLQVYNKRPCMVVQVLQFCS